MSNGLKVDPLSMMNFGKETIVKSTDLKSQIDSLKSNENNLLAIWRGDASKTFDESVTAQLSNLEAFKNLIEELGGKINAGANSFNENEQQNVSDAKKLLSEYDDLKGL